MSVGIEQQTAIRFLTLAILLLILSSNCLADDCVLPMFVAPLHFSNGATTVRTAVADFNNDGNLDVAATAHDASFVGIFMGDGTGNFVRQTVLPAGNFSVPVSAGDFNNDGKQDLAVGSRDGTVWIYLGNGDGTFAAPVQYADGPGEAYEIAVADFNQDGNLDLAIGHQFAGLAIMFGNGTGGFSLAHTYLSGLGPVSVRKADFNNDGKIDLMTANAQGGNVSILLGDGAGGFSARSAPFSGFGALGDFNGDGNIDVVTSNLLFLGDGHGGFGSGRQISSGGSVAADFNGDGKLDVASPGSVAFGDGAGNFAPSSPFAIGSGPSDLTVGDFNNDGKPDLVAPNYYGGDITVWLNNGVNTQDTSPPIISSAPNIVTDATGASGANVSYSIVAFDNSGTTPTLDCSIPSNSLFPIGTTPVSCSAVDACGNRSASMSFNVTVVDEPPVLSLPGDIHATAIVSSGAIVTYSATATDTVSGNLPVTCSPASGSNFPIGHTTVSCSATDGGGHTATGSFNVTVFGCIGCIVPTFEAARNYDVGSIPGRVAVDDFNRDGKPDLAVTSPDSSFVAIFLGDGTGNFGPPSYLQAGSFSVPVATGDFNGDGKPDLAIGSGEGDVWIYLGDGSGGFGQALTYPTSGGATYEIAVADFNGDGKADLALANQFGSVCVLFGNGTGGFSSPVAYAAGTDPTGIAAVDLNNDGKIDLVASNASSNDVSVLLGDGSGHFGVATNFAVGNHPTGFAIGDFNHDNKIDLVVANFSDNSVSVLLGNGTGGFNQTLTYPAGENPTVVRAGDFNGDGKLDLAIPDDYAGTVTILLGDGTGGFSSPFSFAAGSGIVGLTVADLNLDGKPDIVTPNYFDNDVSVLLNTTYQTPLGTNSTVVINNTTFTFDDVTTGGTTSVTPIDPASVGQVPGGFSVSNSVAYEIATTATFTGSVTLAFKVPGPISQADFNNLAILHNVNGTLVDVTASTPARDYSTLTIYATTTSFSPFYVARKGAHIKSLFDQTKAYKSGSTIPIKLQLLNASNANTSSANTSLVTRDLRLISGNTMAPIQDSGNANPDYTFRYDSTLGGTGGGYIFNLSTKGLAPGQYVLSFYVGSDRSFFYTVKFEVK